MVDGLRTPLSSQEELTLRRVAHAAPTVDMESIGRLRALALVEPQGGGWRLTATGKLRHDALPKATLVKGGPSTRLTALFIDGLLEKATAMAKAQGPAAISEGPAPSRPAARAESVSTMRWREPAREPPPEPTLLELREWRKQAKHRLECSRLVLDAQRTSHALQIAESVRRIELSRAALKTLVPRWPIWWRSGPDIAR